MTKETRRRSACWNERPFPSGGGTLKRKISAQTTETVVPRRFLMKALEHVEIDISMFESDPESQCSGCGKEKSREEQDQSSLTLRASKLISRAAKSISTYSVSMKVARCRVTSSHTWSPVGRPGNDYAAPGHV